MTDLRNWVIVFVKKDLGFVKQVDIHHFKTTFHS